MSSARALREWKALALELTGEAGGMPGPGLAAELDRLWLDLTPADRVLAAAWLADQERT